MLHCSCMYIFTASLHIICIFGQHSKCYNFPYLLSVRFYISYKGYKITLLTRMNFDMFSKILFKKKRWDHKDYFPMMLSSLRTFLQIPLWETVFSYFPYLRTLGWTPHLLYSKIQPPTVWLRPVFTHDFTLFPWRCWLYAPAQQGRWRSPDVIQPSPIFMYCAFTNAVSGTEITRQMQGAHWMKSGSRVKSLHWCFSFIMWSSLRSS